jgi:hypothetical protein
VSEVYVCRKGGMILTRLSDVLRENTVPVVLLSAINPTWTGLGSNPGLLRLSHSTCYKTEEEEGMKKKKQKAKKNEK